MSRLSVSPFVLKRVLAWLSLGLALILLVVGSLTLWVKQQALDTDRWV